ncbi:hypothetical protein [uncultured Shewanella sp.]|uniref:hypothetical protein n=1 Tax=uncultured Shewanella sp. TaxID=173975 RepID=UPI002626CCA7|nr:hypothetical protein [uncultured Shewanella sp.]
MIIMYDFMKALSSRFLGGILLCAQPLVSFAQPGELQAQNDLPDEFGLLTRDLVFDKTRQRDWYQKLNYYFDVAHEMRQIRLSRTPMNLALQKSELDAQYDVSTVSFTLGGNLFNRTSVYADIIYEQFKLEGEVIEQTQSDLAIIEPLMFRRGRGQTELFVEYDLGQRGSVGLDGYYGQSQYANNEGGGSYLDQEFGFSLMGAYRFDFEHSDVTLESIFSYRQVLPGDSDFNNVSQHFYSLLSHYRYRFDFALEWDLHGRLSYYPAFDPNSFWDTSFLYSVGSELRYRLTPAMSVFLRLEQAQFNAGGQISSALLKFEYQFGLKQAKRRARRSKIPQLLIR